MADEDIRRLLGIPEYYGILNVVSLGVPKRVREVRHVAAAVHLERF